MSTIPAVSVLMPVRDAAATLAACLGQSQDRIGAG
jgi:hypothetical protein